MGSPRPWPLAEPGCLQVAVTAYHRGFSHLSIQMSSFLLESSSHCAFSPRRRAGPAPYLSLKWAAPLADGGTGVPKCSPWIDGCFGINTGQLSLLGASSAPSIVSLQPVPICRSGPLRRILPHTFAEGTPAQNAPPSPSRSLRPNSVSLS